MYLIYMFSILKIHIKYMFKLGEEILSTKIEIFLNFLVGTIDQ